MSETPNAAAAKVNRLLNALADANRELHADRTRLAAALLAGTELVRSAAPLADAASGDTNHAYQWEKLASVWLALADAALDAPQPAVVKL